MSIRQPELHEFIWAEVENKPLIELFMFSDWLTGTFTTCRFACFSFSFLPLPLLLLFAEDFLYTLDCLVCLFFPFNSFAAWYFSFLLTDLNFFWLISISPYLMFCHFSQSQISVVVKPEFHSLLSAVADAIFLYRCISPSENESSL